MSAVKSSFADVLRAPGMREMITARAMLDVYRSSLVASSLLEEVEGGVMVGDVRVNRATARGVHRAVTSVGSGGNQRVLLVQRLADLITEHAAWVPNAPRRLGWPHLFMNRLAEQLANNLIVDGVVRRRPFRCDAAKADAWLASTLLVMEADG